MKWLNLHILCSIQGARHMPLVRHSRRVGVPTDKNTRLCPSPLVQLNFIWQGGCSGGKLYSSSNRESLDSLCETHLVWSSNHHLLLRASFLKPNNQDWGLGKASHMNTSPHGLVWIWGVWRKNDSRRNTPHTLRWTRRRKAKALSPGPSSHRKGS